MKKKIVIIIAVVAILALAAFLIISRGTVKSPQYKIETVKKGELISAVSASGEIKAEKDVSLKFQTSGLLSWVGVKDGDTVRRGQAIASLDKRDLQMKLKKEMNDFLNERWDFEQTQDDYKVTKEKRLVTDAIQRILDKAQFDLNNVTLDYEISDLTVKLSTIYSPIDGVVVNIDEPFPGINITPATATFRIIDPGSLYFEADIDETDVSKIKLGNQAEVKLDAFPAETISGIVSLIDWESSATSGGGTAYKARIKLDNQNLILRLGMNGDASLIQEKLNDVLLVPISSLLESGGKTYVWLLENNRAKKVEVTVGQSDDEKVQIISGVTEKDKIITSSLSTLKEGKLIKEK